MGDTPVSTRLYKVQKTCWEMLRDRGYLVPEDCINQSLQEFQDQHGEGDAIRDGLTIVAPKINDPQDQIIVFFPSEEKLGVQRLSEYINRMKEDQVYRAILVLQRKLSGPANNERMLVRNRFKIEDFLETELLVNITRHVMVPKHTVLAPEEKATLLRRYRVRESQLPRIQLSDPVARYLGMERGEVVRIVRPSETAGRYVTYRFCI